MTPTPIECPDLEVLFTELEAGEGPSLEHAEQCPLCTAIIEEHRLLEKDLCRLADPLPPPDLVHKVMARVAAEPTPVRRELWTGLSILGASLMMGLGLLLTSDAALSGLGKTMARTLVGGTAFTEALMSGVHALWSTAAGPLVALVAFVILSSVFGLKRLIRNDPTPSQA
ncbi:hypothetical protein [Archangium violaceum]|uniref:Zinc-finger domain-containing protein n=1 Tax=Archangium violaceum Cb vi76 TaxID=1406225 RepID=A0A084SZ66_9BACT|nr:hypothetical protein [Archangium violaceum]KFA93751.1 hypothetical protein Q664_07300 [Archangium violaceum Cb vi76]